MTRRSRPRSTIRDVMVIVAIAAVVLGLIGNFRGDGWAVVGFLLAAMVIVVPLHLAIEGNRRDGGIRDDDRDGP